MFETVDYAEMPIPSCFSEDGERLWAHVRLQIHVYWFYVVYGVSSSDGEEIEQSQIVFFPYIEQLTKLASTQQVTLVEVQLVSPGHLNGEGLWKMEPLKEIWVSQEPDIAHVQHAHIFVVESGRHYIDSAVGTPENKIKHKELLFTFESCK